MMQEEEPQYYEPWQPEVGQRVRIRLSLECEVEGPSGVHAEVLAAMETQGASIGSVWKITRDSQMKGHYYTVHTPSFQFGGESYDGAACAAIELEPLED